MIKCSHIGGCYEKNDIISTDFIKKTDMCYKVRNQ